MELAGELDDRWPGTRKREGREESPDTTLREQRMGNAPGNARGRGWERPRHGKCHRDNTASDAQPGDSPEENLRDIFEWFATRVRVKRWGKSPPPRQ
jgi:hypothetical protein